MKQIELRVGIAIAIALLVGAATWAMGWWAVVPVAVVAAWLLRAVPGAVPSITAGSSLGWALLLGIDAMGGRLGALAHVLAGTLGAPVIAVAFATLAFPALLAWSAATLVTCVARANLHLSDVSQP